MFCKKAARGRGWLRAMLSVSIAALMLAGCAVDDDQAGSLSGHITIPDRVQLDSDTRDVNNPQAPNNTLEGAQEVESMITVAGHVSDSNTTMDSEDYFRVQIDRDKSVVLKIADTNANLDLFLYKDGQRVASSQSLDSRVEEVSTMQGATYIVEVKSRSLSSIYSLALGTSGSVPGLSSQRSHYSEFVPGQALVKLAEKKSPRVFKGAREHLHDRAAGLARRHGARLSRVGPSGIVKIELPLQTRSARPGKNPGQDRSTTRAAKIETLEQIKRISMDPDVAYAEPNFIVRPAIVPDDTYLQHQWNMDLIFAPEAWDLETGAPETTVAVIDTGLLYDHPDISANVLRDGSRVVGYDMISDPQSANDGDGPDPDPYDPGDAEEGQQSSFHGTHVAGIVSAASDNNRGVAGVSWNTRIMPVRVLGKEGGTTYDTVQAIYFAAGLPNDLGVLPRVGSTVRPADIINLSLGGPDFSQMLHDAVMQVVASGVIVIAAAGNESTGAEFYPAAFSEVTGVSAVDMAGDLACYSNFGADNADIAAPGGDLLSDLDNDGNADGILSTMGDDTGTGIDFTYAFYQGTSMAAPHIAGVAALMESVYDLLDPCIMKDLIRGTSECTGSAELGSITNYPKGVRDKELGYGLVDAEKAVMAAMIMDGRTVDTSPRLKLLPDELNFGFSATSLKSFITNRGVDPLGGVTVQEYGAAWLSHQLNGSTDIVFNVERNGLSNGMYEQRVTVSSQYGGTEPVEVSMIKAPFVQSDVGVVYVGVMAPDADEVAAGVKTALSQNYAYNISGVEPGEYLLIGGTDIDNDGFIGDRGELFGVYPSLQAPGTINIHEDDVLTGRDFSIRFIGLPVSAGSAKDSPVRPVRIK